MIKKMKDFAKGQLALSSKSWDCRQRRRCSGLVLQRNKKVQGEEQEHNGVWGKHRCNGEIGQKKLTKPISSSSSRIFGWSWTVITGKVSKKSLQTNEPYRKRHLWRRKRSELYRSSQSSEDNPDKRLGHYEIVGQPIFIYVGYNRARFWQGGRTL